VRHQRCLEPEGKHYEQRLHTSFPMRRRYQRTKRFIVAAEIIVGSFVLASVTAAISQIFITAGEVPVSDVSGLTGSLATALLIGVVLFVDGLRRGRLWW